MVARALLIVLLCAGCPSRNAAPTPCAPGSPSKLELRDAAGQLALAVKPTPEPGTYDLCDAGGKRTGKLEWEPSTVTYKNEQGVLQLKLYAESKTDAAGLSASGPKLRIHLNGDERRVLKPDGVPFGAIASAGVKSTVFDPASRPIATVEPRDKDQAIRGADGATRAYVVPAASSTAAAAFALDGLSAEERATIYFFWYR